MRPTATAALWQTTSLAGSRADSGLPGSISWSSGQIFALPKFAGGNEYLPLLLHEPTSMRRWLPWAETTQDEMQSVRFK